MADVRQAKVNVMEDFRKLDEKALHNKIAELRKEMVDTHRAHKAGELASPAVIGKIRKNVAKAMTALNEKAAAPAQKEEQEK
jgi:ribosomal protein L29